MSFSPSFDYFLNFDRWNREQLSQFFSLVEGIRQNPAKRALDKTATFLFFESSTRTRVSFELAAFQEGYYPSLFTGKEATSLDKGETLEDTFENILAMSPDVVVVRSGDDFPLRDLAAKAQVPVINAGWGQVAHPSQALLDFFTISQRFKNLSEVKLLVVGDVKHSRVFRSLSSLAKLLSVEIAIACPESWNVPGFRKVRTLQEGLEWANVGYFLRTQKERHQSPSSASQEAISFSWSEEQDYSFFLKKGGWVMHPGPVNYGSELTSEVCRHPQSLILSQVQNGVFVRRALLRMAQKGFTL